MSAQQVEFKLITPEHLVLTQLADLVVLPGEKGEFGVLPRHSALISTLKPGIITIYEGGKRQHIFITQGFANVTEEYCVVLTESGEFVDQIDLHEIENTIQTLTEEISIARTDLEKKALEAAQKLLRLKLSLILPLRAH
jgi:F-type H+-transporting ATPase subunit epsilon